MSAALDFCFLGQVPYGDALLLQSQLREEVCGGRRDILLLLEHPTVITLGRSSKREHILAREEELEARGIGVQRVSRGGEVTLHAPGQLVGYPIRRLVSRAVRAHVVGLIEGLRSYLQEAHGIPSRWREDNPGLWVKGAKIAAVGVDARRGVAMHGFALNLTNSLDLYQLIRPCGLDAPVTSLSKLLAREGPSPAVAAPAVARAVGRALGVEELTPCDAEALS